MWTILAALCKPLLSPYWSVLCVLLGVLSIWSESTVVSGALSRVQVRVVQIVLFWQCQFKPRATFYLYRRRTLNLVEWLLTLCRPLSYKAHLETQLTNWKVEKSYTMKLAGYSWTVGVCSQSVYVNTELVSSEQGPRRDYHKRWGQTVTCVTCVTYVTYVNCVTCVTYVTSVTCVALETSCRTSSSLVHWRDSRALHVSTLKL